MTHARQQLRDLAVTTLTGLTTTGANVFNGRVHPLQESELPALVFVYSDADPETVAQVTGSLWEREFPLAVIGVAREVTGAELHDKLDLIAEEVEVAMGAGLAGALSVGIPTTSFDIEDDELDHAIGSVIMVFDVLYQTIAGVPGTLE